MMLPNCLHCTPNTAMFYIVFFKDKPAPIPERPKDWNPRAPPEFVRDVMGLFRLFTLSDLTLGMGIERNVKIRSQNDPGALLIAPLTIILVLLS